MIDIFIILGKMVKNMQKTMEGSVIGPITAANLYNRCKLVLKTYEKTQNVRNLKEYSKKLVQNNSANDKVEIKNGIKKVIMQNNKNVVEEYYDGPNRVMTCNYTVEQHLFKKNSSFKCTFEDPYTQKHATYYFLKLAMMHNFVTDKTEKYINDIAPAERKTLSQH